MNEDGTETLSKVKNMDFFATRVLPWRHDIAKYLLCHINTTPILCQPWVFVWDHCALTKMCERQWLQTQRFLYFLSYICV